MYIFSQQKVVRTIKLFEQTVGETTPFLSNLKEKKFKKEGTSTVALWLEYPPCEQEVVGSIQGHNRPEFSELVVVAFPLGTKDYGSSTMTGPPVSG